MGDGSPPPYQSQAGPSTPPGGSRMSSTSTVSGWTNDKKESAPPAYPAAPPDYTSQKRLVLWRGGGKRPRRARDYTDELCPPSLFDNTFTLDRRQITNVRHGDDGSLLVNGPNGGSVEMWSDRNRPHEYHWGGQRVPVNLLRWELKQVVDGAQLGADSVIDIKPLGNEDYFHMSKELQGAVAVRTGKPDRGLRAALTKSHAVVAWHVRSKAYSAAVSVVSGLHVVKGAGPNDEPYLIPIPPSGPTESWDKSDGGWLHWAAITPERGRQRSSGDRVLRFDVGDVVIALKANGEVWVCSRGDRLEWWLLCVVEHAEHVDVAARGHLVAIYRTSSGLPEERLATGPAAYVANVSVRENVRIHLVHHGGDGMPFVEVSLQPLSDNGIKWRYQAAARTRSGEVHAWSSDVRTPSAAGSESGSTTASQSSGWQTDSWSSTDTTDTTASDRDYEMGASQVTDVVELPGSKGKRLFPISVGVGCALCVSIDHPEVSKDKQRRGLSFLGMLGKGKGRG